MKEEVPTVLLNKWLNIQPERSAFVKPECCKLNEEEYSVYSSEITSQIQSSHNSIAHKNVAAVKKAGTSTFSQSSNLKNIVKDKISSKEVALKSNFNSKPLHKVHSIDLSKVNEEQIKDLVMPKNTIIEVDDVSISDSEMQDHEPSTERGMNDSFSSAISKKQVETRLFSTNKPPMQSKFNTKMIVPKNKKNFFTPSVRSTKLAIRFAPKIKNTTFFTVSFTILTLIQKRMRHPNMKGIRHVSKGNFRIHRNFLNAHSHLQCILLEILPSFSL